jgi:hypothetical protein
MSAQQLFDSFRNYLVVNTAVPGWSYQGSYLEVPEPFQLKVTVLNTAPQGSHHPNITFRNVSVTVRSTEYATPTDASIVTKPLPDNRLARGQSDTVYIDMKALSALPSPLFGPEQIAYVTMTAHVDQNDFFRITESQNVYQDLLPD